MNEAERNANGQYTHGFDKVCTCGGTKGNHEAEAPFACGDLMMGPPCDGFRLDRGKTRAAKAGQLSTTWDHETERFV